MARGQWKIESGFPLGGFIQCLWFSVKQFGLSRIRCEFCRNHQSEWAHHHHSHSIGLAGGSVGTCWISLSRPFDCWRSALSTVGNAAAAATPATTSITDDEAIMALGHSARTVVTVMMANLCFSFWALSQKNDIAAVNQQLNNWTILIYSAGCCKWGLSVCSQQHFGSMESSLINAVKTSTENQIHYMGLLLLNAVSFATYNFASCYVLSHVSVLRHSSLNCLRCMFVTITTCLFFGMKMTCIGGMGITMSFAGFLSFTHFRTQLQKEEQHLKPKDSNVWHT